jgi:glyceraldehyde-3-phosphate dehydrogenase/erythrose-4-phosphate dehydrogenase
LNIVHVVGTGTIGEPLIGLLADFRKELGIDEVTFSKRTPLLTDRTKVWDLLKRDAKLCAEKEKWRTFQELEMEPTYEYEDGMRRATAVIDCTPSGTGLDNKRKYYEKIDGPRGFIAQGSEFGFGPIFAHGINDNILSDTHRYVQVASCNTHNVAAIIKTLAFEGESSHLKEGRFVCMRRASDLSEEKGFTASPQVDAHKNERFGTHHARDAHALFQTMGCDLNLFSSSIKIPTQYMHSIWFSLKLDEPITHEEVVARIRANPFVATTYKDQTALVFSFGRDHGHYGRILNQTTIVLPTLSVREHGEVVGFSFTPQDGNSLLSSVAATERLLHPETWREKMKCLNPFLFREV